MEGQASKNILVTIIVLYRAKKIFWQKGKGCGSRKSWGRDCGGLKKKLASKGNGAISRYVNVVLGVRFC